MTNEGFKEIHAEDSPIKMLHLLMENIGIYGEDMVSVAEAKHNRNEKDADYWRGEVRAMSERIVWLRGKIEEALKAQEPRVMTLAEVEEYCMASKDDLSFDERCDLDDKPPLYVEYRHEDPIFVHWRSPLRMWNLTRENYFKESYGVNKRCWTSRPTDVQKEAMPWES